MGVNLFRVQFPADTIEQFPEETDFSLPSGWKLSAVFAVLNISILVVNLYS